MTSTSQRFHIGRSDGVAWSNEEVNKSQGIIAPSWTEPISLLAGDQDLEQWMVTFGKELHNIIDPLNHCTLPTF